MDASVLRRLRTLASAVHGSRNRVEMAVYAAGVGTSCTQPSRVGPALGELRRLLADLDADDRHYAASNLYALSMGSARRKRLAAYFTPPFVVRSAIDAAIEAGLDLRTHSVMDPAAGGAAFLSAVAARMREASCLPADIGRRLHGVEIDPGLAAVASALVAARAGISPAQVRMKTGDSLRLLNRPQQALYDAVLANPPYGRATGSAARTGARHSEYVNPSHVNRYALFSGLATKLVRSGGVIVLVIPASFMTGPLFAPLRAHFRKTCRIRSIGMIASRRGAFLDVTQDACVLTLTRSPKDTAQDQYTVPFALLSTSGRKEPCGVIELPEDAEAPWRLPSARPAPARFGLLDYGVEARAGYFVWNREVSRMSKRPSKNSVPLIWAENVRPGQACWPTSPDGSGVDYVKFPSDSKVVIRESVIVLQRTTNNRQPRRLVPAIVPHELIKRHGGFTTENHTIVIRRTSPSVDLQQVCALLATEAVDREFRRMSTGAHVAVTALRCLPLPDPELFRSVLARTGDAEQAASEAYLYEAADEERHLRMIARV